MSRARSRERIDALVAIGGEDTLGVAAALSHGGRAVIGVPKTIDNDLSATDFTFGFQTAVQIATDAIDRLHTTAESHDRVMVVEVMGRHAGWIATYAGIAGGADIVLVPEEPFDISEVCARIEHRHRHGASFSIVVVAEGALPAAGTLAVQDAGVDEFGHVRLGGISNTVAAEIGERTGYETRVTILGHVLRGGTPTAYDRVLATRFGVAAVDAVEDRAFGMMVALARDRHRARAHRRRGERAEDRRPGFDGRCRTLPRLTPPISAVAASRLGAWDRHSTTSSTSSTSSASR